jgi:hypothetical protein
MIEKLKIFKELLDTGWNIKQAALKAGIPPKNVHYYINKFNWKASGKYRKFLINDTYFDVIDTEAKAYFLGFFIADGYLSVEKKITTKSTSFRICMNNSIDDLEVVKRFQEEISLYKEVEYRERILSNIIRKKQVCFRFSSKYMFDILVNKYNIIPNKTKNISFEFPFNEIPEKLVRHFIRGFFDGDGSFSDNNLRLISTSLVFVNQLCDIIEKEFGVLRNIYTVQGKTVVYYSFRFNSFRHKYSFISRLHTYFYEDSTIFLSRKKDKIENYLNTVVTRQNNIY